ncbi:probable maltase-glucoamylase 2 [Argopecten irradians]|uniref:probable maltase-glucoamylase 2 n=1 Tax=Argopecten irradians TaxID=31199 RepID=UPI003721AF0A
MDAMQLILFIVIMRVSDADDWEITVSVSPIEATTVCTDLSVTFYEREDDGNSIPAPNVTMEINMPSVCNVNIPNIDRPMKIDVWNDGNAETVNYLFEKITFMHISTCRTFDFECWNTQKSETIVQSTWSGFMSSCFPTTITTAAIPPICACNPTMTPPMVSVHTTNPTTSEGFTTTSESATTTSVTTAVFSTTEPATPTISTTTSTAGTLSTTTPTTATLSTTTPTTATLSTTTSTTAAISTTTPTSTGTTRTPSGSSQNVATLTTATEPTDTPNTPPPTTEFGLTEPDSVVMSTVTIQTTETTTSNILRNMTESILDKWDSASPCLTIADVGSSDSTASMDIFNDIIERCARERIASKVRQIMIYYTDIPKNDFNRMTDAINAGLHIGPDIFYAAVGRTMFEQCLPDRSNDLIISSLAAMYLSKCPCKLRDACFPDRGDGEERKQYYDQSMLDWITFLVMRGKELRKEGYLVVLTLGTTDRGDTTLHLKGGTFTLDRIFKSLMEDSLITKEEFINCNVYHEVTRREADFALPFAEKDGDVQKGGLELVSTRSFVSILDHPSFGVTEKDERTKKLYADRIVAGIKPWLYNFIYNGLGDNRSNLEKEQLLDVYFKRIRDFAFMNGDLVPQMALIEIVARKRF